MMRMRPTGQLVLLSLSLGVQLITGGQALAQPAIVELVDSELEAGVELAKTIWSHAELGYLEYQSSAALQDFLTQRGFSVETEIAGMPTAFIASFGAVESRSS